MSMRNRGLFNIALEDDTAAVAELGDAGEPGDAGDDTVLLTPSEGADIENETAELTDEVEVSSDEIGEITGTIDNGVNWVDKLMEVGDSLDKSAIAGIGIDEVSIEPTMLAVEALCIKLGLESSIPFPALESFQSPSTRIISTHVVVEKIGETVKKGKDAIVRMFKMLLEKIKELGGKLMRLFRDNFPKHIKELRKRVDALPEDNTEKEIHDKSLIRTFGRSGQGKINVKNVEDFFKGTGFKTGKGPYINNGSFKDGDLEFHPIDVSDSATIEVANKNQLKELLQHIESCSSSYKTADAERKTMEENVKNASKLLDTEKSRDEYHELSQELKRYSNGLKLLALTIKEGLKYVNRCITARKASKKE